MGAGAKQQNIQNMQILQGLMTQLYQLGFVGPEQAYNFAKRYIEEIGFKNVDDFVMNPQEVQAKQAQQQPQDSMSESMRAAVTDAPWQVQMQWWAKQGFQVTPEMFTEQAVQKSLETAVDAHAKADATRGNTNGPAGITSQAAGAGREHGAGVPRVSQAEAGQNPAGNAPTDGTADNGSGIAGQSDGLQGGGAGMPIS